MKKTHSTTEKQASPSLAKIILEFLGLVVLSLLLGLFLQNNKNAMPFDRFFYGLADKVPHGPFLDSIMSVFDYNFLPISAHPQFFLIIMLVAVIYIGLKKPKDFWYIVLALTIGGIIARLIIFIDTTLVYRQRPWLFLPNHVSNTLKEALKSWTSYPSGHTRDTLMIGLIVSYFIPKLKYFMIFLALLVGFSRLYYGVHFPTDILSGLIIGYFAYIIVIKLTEYIRGRFYPTHGSR